MARLCWKLLCILTAIGSWPAYCIPERNGCSTGTGHIADQELPASSQPSETQHVIQTVDNNSGGIAHMTQPLECRECLHTQGAQGNCIGDALYGYRPRTGKQREFLIGSDFFCEAITLQMHCQLQQATLKGGIIGLLHSSTRVQNLKPACVLPSGMQTHRQCRYLDSTLQVCTEPISCSRLGYQQAISGSDYVLRCRYLC